MYCIHICTLTNSHVKLRTIRSKSWVNHEHDTIFSRRCEEMHFNTIQSAQEQYYIVCREQFKCETYENKVKIMSDSIEIRTTIPHGVATISRLLKLIGLFCRISTLLWGSFAKETYTCKEPTNRSHPICSRRLQQSALQHNTICNRAIQHSVP